MIFEIFSADQPKDSNKYSHSEIVDLLENDIF